MTVKVLVHADKVKIMMMVIMVSVNMTKMTTGSIMANLFFCSLAMMTMIKYSPLPLGVFFSMILNYIFVQ